MVSVVQENRKISYATKMLACNHFEFILPVKIMGMDQNIEYLYDTSGKLTLRNKMEYGIKRELISRLFYHILNVIKEAKEYLLDPNAILFEPDMIFCNQDKFFFCYSDGNSQTIFQQFCEILGFIMGKMDHSDKELVVFVYGLYHLCQEEACSLTQIQTYLENEKKSEHNEVTQPEQEWKTTILSNNVGESPWSESRQKGKGFFLRFLDKWIRKSYH